MLFSPEEIAWRESRSLPEGLRNRAYSGYPGGRPLEEADVVRYQRMKVVPRELHN